MEGLGINPFSDIYRNRRVLLTGHTGFKGSWLSLWLKMLDADVTGIALAPETAPSHWDLLALDMPGRLLDIRDISALRKAMEAAQPEIIFHLAAQSLVRRSYNDPLLTWGTNVMGTANLLDICRDLPGIKAIVAITSDKCYENREQTRGYREDDTLGGHDPYSASKAAAELVASSYRHAFYSGDGAPLLATARAGNVVGGGDWSEDRLIPDLVRAVTAGKILEIRYPHATRPWQHVLESLSGYLLLGRRLLEGRREFAGAWNFGPDHQGNLTVTQVLNELREYWPELTWKTAGTTQPHEAGLLYLDASKARSLLGWKPVLDFRQTMRMTADWYREYLATGTAISRQQLQEYSERLNGAAG